MPKAVAPELLNNTVFSRDLSADERATLAQQMSARDVADGEKVVTAGDQSRTLFMLLEGRLEVMVPAQGGEEETVATLKPGEVFGTGAFVEGTPRLADVRANGPASVLTLEPSDLEALLDTHPRVVYDFMRALFRARHDTLLRLYEENEQLTNYVMKVHGRY